MSFFFTRNTYLKVGLEYIFKMFIATRCISFVETSSYSSVRALVKEMTNAGVHDECEICFIGGRDIMAKFLSPLRPISRDLSYNSLMHILKYRRFIKFCDLKSYLKKNAGFSKLTDKQQVCARYLLIFDDVAIAAKHSAMPLKTFYNVLWRIAGIFNLHGVRDVKLFLQREFGSDF